MSRSAARLGVSSLFLLEDGVNTTSRHVFKQPVPSDSLRGLVDTRRHVSESFGNTHLAKVRQVK